MKNTRINGNQSSCPPSPRRNSANQWRFEGLKPPLAKGDLGGVKTLLVLFFLLLFISVNLTAQDHPSPGSEDAVEDSLVLEQYVQKALENNPRLEALFQQYYARLEQIPQVGTLPDPEIMFQYHINPMERGNPLSQTTVSAMQMIPWFGTLGKRKEYVEKVAMMEWTAFEKARNETISDVRIQWYRMHELHHHLMIFRQNLELLERLEGQIRARYESGRASQTDLLRIQIEQEDLKIRVENREGDLAAMKIQFNALIGRESGDTIGLSDIMYTRLLTRNEEEIRRNIREQSPEIRGREFKEEAALAAEEQARLEGLPSFGLGVMAMNSNYMYMPLMPDDGPALTGSLTIRLPLYRSKYRAQQREAQIEARSAREERQDAVNMLNAEAESLLQQYRNARRRVALHEERLIPRTRQALDIALTDYSAGRTGFEQIIQLQQQLLDYEMKLNTAYMEQNIAVAEIESLSGEYNVQPEDIE